MANEKENVTKKERTAYLLMYLFFGDSTPGNSKNLEINRTKQDQ